MGWNNSPPLFCAITETIANITNVALNQPKDTSTLHLLDTEASKFNICTHSANVPTQIVPWDPSLLTTTLPVKYADAFVNDFVGLAQHPHLSRVH